MHPMNFFLDINDKVISAFCVKVVEDYLFILKKIKKEVPHSATFIEPPEPYKDDCENLQLQVKKVFKQIVSHCEDLGVTDDFFHEQRKDLTLIKERPIIANLDALYCIAKNHNFKFHLYKSTETMEYFLKSRTDFRNNLKILYKENALID